MQKKKVTTEDLARMVAKGFEESKSNANDLKKDVANLRSETKEGFEHLEKK